MFQKLIDYNGAPYGIRTRVSALRGLRPDFWKIACLPLPGCRLRIRKAAPITQDGTQTGWLRCAFLGRADPGEKAHATFLLANDLQPKSLCGGAKQPAVARYRLITAGSGKSQFEINAGPRF
jgi:hypothetical protein